jgi:hypothetical protein
MKAKPFYMRHTGPYILVVWRGMKSEVLKARVEGEEAELEALALLTDPRDTIDSVHVWTGGRFPQHVMTFKGTTPALAAPVVVRPNTPLARPVVIDTHGLTPAQKAWVTRKARAAQKVA